MSKIDRRDFLKRGGALLAASSLPLSLVEVAFGKSARKTLPSPISLTPTSPRSRVISLYVIGIAG